MISIHASILLLLLLVLNVGLLLVLNVQLVLNVVLLLVLTLEQ